VNIIEFTLLVWVSSLLAGLVGSLTGLGGGIVITPLLTLALGVDIRYAIGATLVSVIRQSAINNGQSTIGNVSGNRVNAFRIETDGVATDRRRWYTGQWECS
jgi:hypothetical protein